MFGKISQDAMKMCHIIAFAALFLTSLFPFSTWIIFSYSCVKLLVENNHVIILIITVSLAVKTYIDKLAALFCVKPYKVIGASSLLFLKELLHVEDIMYSVL